MRYANPPEVKVYGDWMLDEDAPPTGYDAQAAAVAIDARLVDRWNGWAVPALTAENVERLVESQEKMLEGAPRSAIAETDALSFDGQRVRVTYGYTDDVNGEPEVGFIEATDIDGVPHWRLDLGWTFSTLDFDDPASPTAAQKKAFESLREGLDAGERLDGYSLVVEPDGSHTFEVTREVVEAPPASPLERNRRRVTRVPVRRYTIGRDGGVR